MISVHDHVDVYTYENVREFLSRVHTLGHPFDIDNLFNEEILKDLLGRNTFYQTAV